MTCTRKKVDASNLQANHPLSIVELLLREQASCLPSHDLLKLRPRGKPLTQEQAVASAHMVVPITQYTPGTWVGAHRSRPALHMSGSQQTADIQRELQDLGKSVFTCA